MVSLISAEISAIALFAGMLLLSEIGRRIGLRRLAQDTQGDNPGVSTLKGTVFGLTTLILAFSFSGAMSRYDARRQLIVVEGNAMGTAYLRLDLLPADTQPELRELFRAYVDSRIEVYKKIPDLAAVRQELSRSKELQNEIWARAVAACGRASSPAVTSLVLSPLNEMIDITTTRTVTALSHPPLIIFVMIFLLVLVSSLIAGRDMAAANQKNRIPQLAFALILAATVFVILEIEYPRVGFVRLDAFDQVIVDVREGMK
ncbi:MAG TPA: DUF4239 domain-containing protein [Blastocatellia bacterium]|nr:DUF4239 domain-containing protein [Blastocatellia bacterium]